MVNDIAYLLLAKIWLIDVRILPEIMDCDRLSVKQWLHNHLSECTFKIDTVEIYNIMLMVLTISGL